MVDGDEFSVLGALQVHSPPALLPKGVEFASFAFKAAT
jgi:hypothetical protein